MSRASYVYCIVKGTRRPAVTRTPPGLPGGTPPQLVTAARSLWLVVSEVPLKVYGPGALDAALADLDWVGQVALAHEHVVEHFTRRAGLTVIPMKLFTMFSGSDRAVGEIASRKATIDRVMRRISGAEEWGVRIVRGELASAADPAAPRPASGTAFLAARKQARDEVRSARLVTAEAAAHAFTVLETMARDTVRRETPPAEGVTPPLLEAAFLVPKRSRARFDRAARAQAIACAAAGAHLTLTGPWPPYHFVRLDEAS